MQVVEKTKQTEKTKATASESFFILKHFSLKQQYSLWQGFLFTPAPIVGTNTKLLIWAPSPSEESKITLYREQRMHCNCNTVQKQVHRHTGTTHMANANCAPSKKWTYYPSLLCIIFFPLIFIVAVKKLVPYRQQQSTASTFCHSKEVLWFG